MFDYRASKKPHLFLSCTVAISLILPWSVASIAQESDTDSVGLEEVIVTAQRREQNLQDVPISITTLSGDKLLNIFSAGEDIRALATRLPGFYAESSNGRLAPRFYIRGLGNTDFDLAASQPVSVVIDEVVQENVVLKSFPLFDLERIEVIKGPQGSLFGRNTPGGIVKLESVKPEQNTSAYANISYGSFGGINIEGAYGSSITEDLSGRVAVLYQKRNDWITNEAEGQTNNLAGFREFAWRTQLLFEPIDKLSILGNLHGRSFLGKTPPFRANVIAQGTDSLADFFERQSVTHDAGDTNLQQYVGFGANVKVEYDLSDNYVLKSITAYEETNGSSRGDIDGGAGFGDTADPAPIPFPSDTQDGLNNLSQVTQEFSVAFSGEGLNWQAGVFYFDSKLDIETFPFFIPSTIVRHENTTWAVFAQGSYNFTESLNLTLGARYTNDEKNFQALSANIVSPISVDDGRISYDAALSYAVNDQLSLYGRYARGFRAPTIQGRNIAFGFPASVADAETIDASEVGIKSQWLNNRLRLNAALFYYQISDQQLTAIGGSTNSVMLINAEKGIGKGVEFDLEWVVNQSLSVSLGYSLNDTELQDEDLRIEPCGSGLCTVFDELDDDGNAIVDGNPFPHAPQHIVYVTFDGSLPLGDAGVLFLSADYAWQGHTEFLLYDSAEFQSEGNFELGLRFGFRDNEGRWEVAFFGRNITDEANLKGGIDFNNNTGILNEPRIIGISLRVGTGS